MMKRLTAAAVAASLTFFSISSPAQAGEPYWQCVTFARMFSGIQIFGDAWTWWESATGKYAKGSTPETGAVLVFRPNGRMTRGHVAVISAILSDQVVQITHANWGGSRGRVEENVTLVDVSPKGDWSLVKVWHAPSGSLGVTTYPTYGFIYQTAREAGRAASQIAAGSGQD
jgi:surface antigen